MSKRLTREEIKLAARFLVEYIELQSRGASEIEMTAWRARVEEAFPPAEYHEALMVTIEEILRAKGYTDLERMLKEAA